MLQDSGLRSIWLHSSGWMAEYSCSSAKAPAAALVERERGCEVRAKRMGRETGIARERLTGEKASEMKGQRGTSNEPINS